MFFRGSQFDDLMATVKSASDSSTIVVAGKPDTRQKVEGFNKMVRTPHMLQKWNVDVTYRLCDERGCRR